MRDPYALSTAVHPYPYQALDPKPGHDVETPMLSSEK